MITKNHNGSTALDKIDCGMINLLQIDGRMPIVSLATKLTAEFLTS